MFLLGVICLCPGGDKLKVKLNEENVSAELTASSICEFTDFYF